MRLDIVVELEESCVKSFVIAFDAAEEHGSLEAADDAVGGGADIDGGANGAGSNACLEGGAKHLLPIGERGADAFAKDRIAVVGVDGCIQQGAAAGQSSGFEEVGDVAFEAVGVVVDLAEAFAAFA